MEKVYTITELAREFNFEGAGAKTFLKGAGIKPVRVIVVGKREITLYNEAARTACAEERKRRNEARAERARIRTAPAPKPAGTTAPTADLGRIEEMFTAVRETLDKMLATIEAQGKLIEKVLAEVQRPGYHPLGIGPVPAPSWPSIPDGVTVTRDQAPLAPHAFDIQAALGVGEPLPVDD